MSDKSRFHMLLSKWIDDELSVEEFVELQEILEQDPGARESFTDQLLLDSMLSDELGQESLTALVDLVSETPNARSVEAQKVAMQTEHRRSTGSHRRNLLRAVGGLIAAASVVGLVFAWLFQGELAVFAGADRIVEAAMHTHSEPIERVYVVQVERGDDPINRIELPRDVRVSTQGDRFWVSMNGHRRWAWGRDLQGSIWITLGPDRAVYVAPDEVGIPLRYIGDLYTLNLETMLNSFLKYCRLDRTVGPTGTDVITAVPRPLWRGRPLKRAVIEVDRESKAIRKLTLERQFPDEERCVVTFTLVESRLAEDATYSPQGHLTEPYRIFTQSTPIRERHEMVLEWFGKIAERWIVTSTKASQ
jgi:hypothetical protein